VTEDGFADSTDPKNDGNEVGEVSGAPKAAGKAAGGVAVLSESCTKVTGSAAGGETRS